MHEGGNDGASYLGDILQYDTISHTWEEVGQMKQERGLHAVGLLGDVSVICP